MNPLYLFGREMTPLRKLLLMKVAAGGVPLSEYTATGNPLTFETNIAKPLKSLVIPWTPTQSGTGDPSPENVRPISGVSSLNVWRTGKNLFDEQYPGILEGSTVVYRPLYVGEGTFTMSSDITMNTSNGRNLFFLAGNVSTGANTITNGISDGKPVTQTSVGGYVTIAYRKYNVGETADPTKSHTMLIRGSSDAEYEPYSGSIVSVVFPAEPGTVYGGSLNLTTGVLTATHKSVTYVGAESEAWTKTDSTAYTRYYITADGIKRSSQRTELLCNIGKFGSGNDEFTIFNSGTSVFYYPPSTVSTVEAFKTWLASNNMQVYYELATPLTWQLTPQEITSLIGTNVLWSDTNGSNTAVYLKKG